MAESKWTFAQNFYSDFHVKTTELASHLDALKCSSGATPNEVQAAAVDISQLAKRLSEATGSLPSYDQRQCEIQLKVLEKALEELRGTSSAVPKFSFKRKSARSKTAVEPSGIIPTSRDALPVVDLASSLSSRYLTISDLEDRNHPGEMTLSDISNCIVNLLHDHTTDFSAVHLQRVSDSVLLLPHINGSILLHDMSNCVLVVGCHQFRMHSSTRVDVYVSAGTNPIIEHCSDIRFSVYPNSLPQAPSQQAKEVFTVQDFSHIRETASPNWSVLPEDKRQRNWPVSPLQGQMLIAELRSILPGDGDKKGASQD